MLELNPHDQWVIAATLILGFPILMFVMWKFR